jgi:hypothetical protein
MRGALVTIPDPLGRKSFPTMLSRTDDLPELCEPTTTIWGSSTAFPLFLGVGCEDLGFGVLGFGDEREGGEGGKKGEREERLGREGGEGGKRGGKGEQKGRKWRVGEGEGEGLTGGTEVDTASERGEVEGGRGSREKKKREHDPRGDQKEDRSHTNTAGAEVGKVWAWWLDASDEGQEGRCEMRQERGRRRRREDGKQGESKMGN